MKKLGFGAMRLPLATPDDAADIDYGQLIPMVDAFLSAGFNYFDTAYPYHKGESEVACRKAVVERYPRDAFLLADKLPIFLTEKPEDYKRIFREQLARCGVDYFDNYMLHNLTRISYPKTRDMGGFEFVRRLREEGRARRIGFSYHDQADLLDEILAQYPDLDFVQLQINYYDWESESVQSRKCYEVARKHNKPVIVMEPLRGGGLAQLPDEAEKILKAHRPDLSIASWAVRFAASFEGVETVLSGMSTLEQLQDNIAYMRNFQPIDRDERTCIEKAAGILRAVAAIPCTACRYCIPECPKGIDIPAYFSVFNNLKIYGDNPQFIMHADLHYANLKHDRAAPEDCIGCRKCEPNCPQHIEIPEALKAVAEAFVR